MQLGHLNPSLHVPVCLVSVLLTGIPESEDAEVSTGKQVLWLLSGASDARCSSVHEGPKTTVFALQEPSPQWNLSSLGDQYSFPVSCCLPAFTINLKTFLIGLLLGPLLKCPTDAKRAWSWESDSDGFSSSFSL